MATHTVRFIARLFRFLISIVFSLTLLGLLAIGGVYYYFSPHLPSIESLKDVRLQVPLRVYTRNHDLIAEFGEKRRSPVMYKDIPRPMVDAFLAAEDDRFFEHPGVDYQGLLGAAYELITTGKKKRGGSTITMQVARNFFLSSEKTYERKIKEILLAIKIEKSLSKEEILELYLNKIYLGNRAYGVGAAAEVYYGDQVRNLTLAQIAMIAGLPKAPSRFNPIANPERALIRRTYVLERMLKLGKITQAQHDEATQAPITARVYAPVVDVEAPYIAEMVRAEMVRYFGDDAYTSGFDVITTIDMPSQQYANQALRNGLELYDQRHGFRGPEAQIPPEEEPTAKTWDARLANIASVSDLLPGVVIQVMDKAIRVYIGDEQLVQIEWAGLEWAHKYIDENRFGAKPKTASDIVSPGDIIRVKQDKDGNWQLSQVPDVAGAFVALNPKNGAILALVGGYDFFYSKFNRVTQSQRQPGSGFKPILYTTALENGFTPASTINDAPIVFKDPSLQGGIWRPENYSSKFFGPTRLREALYKSRNLVSIRLMDAVGIEPVQQMARRFGFSDEEIPGSLTLALGSGTTAPLRMSQAFSVFANGGFHVQPYLIDYVQDMKGNVIFEADPLLACPACSSDPTPNKAPAESTDLVMSLDTYRRFAEGDTQPLPRPARLSPRVLSPQVHFQITSILKDVVRRGTGRRALQLGRSDLAGKTGTTNEQRDAWFNGFNPDIVGTAWVGFDKLAPLGRRETGGKAALPVWIGFMEKALAGKPERHHPQPDGMVTVKINPKTGLVLAAGDSGGIFETFRKELVPEQGAALSGDSSGEDPGSSGNGNISDIRQDLF